MTKQRDWSRPPRPGCAILSWWDSTPDFAGAIWWGSSGPGCTITKVTVMIPLTTRAATILQRQGRHEDTPHVFTQSDGRAYSLEQVGMAVIRTAKQAQLPGVSLHTLRHTFISRLVQAGRPLPEVAALAGHRDIKMTLRYAHLAPSHLRAGIDALEQRNTRHIGGLELSTELCVTPVSQDFGGSA